MKRLCLFAGFSKANIIEDYAVHAVKELSNHSDVYYFAANDLPGTELGKLDEYAKGRWGSRHDRYDFGSWQKLMFILGWRFIEQYDALILINDSCYGPFFSLDKVFGVMNSSRYDMWGITMNYGHHMHLQSYFLHIDKKIFQAPFFRDFFETIIHQGSKKLICINYEIGLSRLVCEHGFRLGCYINRKGLGIPHEVDISEYQNSLLQAGSPFIKKKVFLEAGFAKEDPDETRILLKQHDYPVDFSTLKSQAAEEGTGEQSRRAIVARISRKIFNFFYGPIKNRIIIKIDQIHEQIGVVVNENQNIRYSIHDLQGSIRDLHGHIDWVQRDIMLAVMNHIDLGCLPRLACLTEHPVAYDSPDHIHPVGTVLDHTRHPRFIRACEDFFTAKKRLAFLDLGCSAGGLVLDAVLRGHIGIGLEGSDISRLQQRAEWRLLRENLFTCDISKPFTLTLDGSTPFLFDVVSAWEVLEHLTKEGVDGLFVNLARHMPPGSIFACSISQVDGGFTDDGLPLHQTIEPLTWWEEIAAGHGFELMKKPPFPNLDYARGNGNPSIYYQPLHSYQEKPGDCELAVFRKQHRNKER